MIAGTFRATRCGALAAFLSAILLAGCASTGHPVASSPTTAAGPERLMHMAEKAKERGQLSVAAALYRQAHDDDPTNVTPLLALGQVLMEMREPRQAGEAFSAAILLDGGNVEALRGYGNAHLAIHDPEQAIPALKQALERSANDFRVLNALGVAFDMTGDHEGAQQFYKTGLKLAPDNASLRSNYALSLALSGHTDAAVETLKPLSDASRTTPQQRATMALVYGLAGNRNEAERLSRMDLDDASVKSNLNRIEAMRQSATPASTNLASVSAPPARPSLQVAAVETAPLPVPADPKPAAPQPLPAADVTVVHDKPTVAGAVITPAAATLPDDAVGARDEVGQQAHTETGTAHEMASSEVAEATAVSPEPSAPTPGSQGERGWLVQLASYSRPELADRGWREISAAAPELLGSTKPRIEQAQLADSSVVYRLRMGPFGAYSEANKLCEGLKTHGLECFVAKM